MENLEKTSHGNIFANMTITTTNYDYIEETVKIAAENPHIAGIMLNFLTPPPADIVPSREQKLRAVDLIFRLKKQGYPVLNSNRALK